MVVQMYCVDNEPTKKSDELLIKSDVLHIWVFFSRL